MLNYRNYGRLWRVYGKSLLKYGSASKLANALRTEWSYRQRKADVKTTPYLLFIEPLYYCNLTCPLCQRQTFGEARENDAGKLRLEVFDKILDELGDYLWQCHIFGLGEPLLDWPLTKKIVQKAHQRRIFTLVSTNCTLITEKITPDIVSSGLDYLVCAIDGISQESYSKYRVGGDVEKALKGLRLICAERDRQGGKLGVEWQYLVNRFNVHEMDEARRIADDMGVFLRFAPMGGMEWDAKLQEEWLPKATEQWQDSKLAPGQARNEWHCYWLWRGVVVNSNGQMARCPGYQNIAMMGSVSDTKVMDIYNGPSSQRSRQLFDKGPVPDGDFPTPCNTCAFYKREHGGANSAKPVLA